MSRVNINQKIQDLVSEKIEDLNTIKGDMAFAVGEKIIPMLCKECDTKIKKAMKDEGTKKEVLTLKSVLIESLFAAYKDDVVFDEKGKLVYSVTAEDNYNKFMIGRKIAWTSQRKKVDIDLSSGEIETAKKAVYRKFIQSPMIMGQVYDMLDNKKHDFELEGKKEK